MLSTLPLRPRSTRWPPTAGCPCARRSRSERPPRGGHHRCCRRRLPAGPHRGRQHQRRGDLDVTGSTVFRGAGAGPRSSTASSSTGCSTCRHCPPFDQRHVPGPDHPQRPGTRGRRWYPCGNADLVLRDCAVTGNRTTGDGGGISSDAQAVSPTARSAATPPLHRRRLRRRL